MSGKGPNYGRHTKLGYVLAGYSSDNTPKPTPGYLKQIKDKLNELEARIEQLEKPK